VWLPLGPSNREDALQCLERTPHGFNIFCLKGRACVFREVGRSSTGSDVIRQLDAHDGNRVTCAEPTLVSIGSRSMAPSSRVPIAAAVTMTMTITDGCLASTS
jgi:hypothetical protein